MRVVVQRSLNSHVSVNQKVVGKIDKGLVILVGFTENDSEKEIDYLVSKIVNLRIFDDENSVYAGFCHVFETENYTLCKEMLRYVPDHVEKFRCSDIKTSGIQKNT